MKSAKKVWRGHEAFVQQLGEFLAEVFDLALIGEFAVAPLLGEMAVVENFDFLFDDADGGSTSRKCVVSGRPMRVSAATNLVSRLGSERLP